MFFLFCAATALQSVAQMKVTKFELLEHDMTANMQNSAVTDVDGVKAALIKIPTHEYVYTFESGSAWGGVVEVKQQPGEMWVYLRHGTRKLTIRRERFDDLEYTFEMPIEKAKTYQMLIDLGVGRHVNITSDMAGSNIQIDGENCGTSPIYNRYLTYGKHKVTATKDRFEGEKEFTIDRDDEGSSISIHIEQRDMSDRFGDVTVTVDNRAEIYFEGKIVATGEWKTQLREGNYTVETRKADCDPMLTSFTVVAQTQNDIKATPPTQHQGRLSIFTRPGNVSTSPYNLKETVTLPVGTYHIDFSRKGFVSQSHEYTIRRDETTRDTVTLERVKYVKPLAFYFGVGYTIRTLGGVTAALGAVIKNHDIQAHYTFGLKSSKTVHAYSTDGNDNYLNTLSFKQHSFGIKYGYQFNLLRQLAITPQLGFTMDRLNASVENGTNRKYANGASACDLAIGFKLILVPFQHCYIFAAPEYDVAVSKDDNYKRLTEISNVSAGGFMANVGIMVNF